MGVFATGFSGVGVRVRGVSIAGDNPAAGTYFHDRSKNAQAVSDFARFGGKFAAGPWASDNVPPSGTDTNSALAADAVVALPAHSAGLRHVITDVAWGYFATPQAGSFLIESPSGTPIFGPVPVTTSGPGFFMFEDGLRCPKGQAALVRLKSGGAGVSGVVSVGGRRLE